MKKIHLAKIWNFMGDPFLKACRTETLWAKLGTLYYRATFSIIFLSWRGQREMPCLTPFVTPQAQTFMKNFHLNKFDAFGVEQGHFNLL